MTENQHSKPSGNLANKQHIDALTGLRTLAAFWVVLFHFHDEIQKALPYLPSMFFHFINSGWLGVDVFFVLSGFVIAYNYSGTFKTFSAPTYYRYLWMRLARIYPLHLFVLAMYALLLLLSNRLGGTINNPQDFSIPGLLLYVLLIQSWGFGFKGWNSPAWSITAEWFAYLIFPVVRNFTARLSTRGLLLCSFLALMVVPFIGTFATGWVENFINLSRVICEFTTGSCLYWLYCKGFAKNWNWELLSPIFMVGCVVAATASTAFGISAYWATVPVGMMVFALTQNRGWVVGILSSKQMIFGGQVSYAVYLTHLLSRSLLNRVLEHFHMGASTVLLFEFAGIVAVATAAYFFIEEPSRHAMRKFYDQFFAPKSTKPVLTPQVSATQVLTTQVFSQQKIATQTFSKQAFTRRVVFPNQMASKQAGILRLAVLKLPKSRRIAQ